MRIVYDYSGIVAPLSASARIQRGAPASGGRESVLVVHVGRKDPVGASGSSIADPAEEQGQWKTSGEALSRDRQVRGHENAHLSALGPYAASSILYDTARGADGESIAVGGRIAVNLAEVPGDPEATLRKARTILNASGAPGDPSAADARVAAKAYSLMQRAQAELRVDALA